MLDPIVFIGGGVKADTQVVGEIHTGGDLFALAALNFVVEVKSEKALNWYKFLEAQQLLHLAVSLGILQQAESLTLAHQVDHEQ